MGEMGRRVKKKHLSDVACEDKVALLEQPYQGGVGGGRGWGQGVGAGGGGRGGG